MSTPACNLAELLRRLLARELPIAVIGLGYVGLPLAVCLAKRFAVIGFDIATDKVARLQQGIDLTREINADDIRGSGIVFTSDPALLRNAALVIVAVPTPVDAAKRPDLSPLLGASTFVGRNLRPGAVVVFESTVYPGATEEVCIPLIERESGLIASRDFTYGYSPERINPGDKERTIERIRKVVSGSDAATLDLIAGVYGAVIPAGIFRAASVKVAEAAKVIENTQRDLNIALVNELALIFHRLGIDTLDVLEAAGTKWNFLPFRPGLVGGHCIGVDPYYLTHKATEVGYSPEVILAGRRINDGMGFWIAQECVRLLIAAGRPVKGARVLVLGLTFKEDVPDVRNSRVIDVITELKRFDAVPLVCDPVADPAHAWDECGIELCPFDNLPHCEAIIVAVAHREVRALSPSRLLAISGPGTPVLDIKGCFDRAEFAKSGMCVWRL